MHRCHGVFSGAVRSSMRFRNTWPNDKASNTNRILVGIILLQISYIYISCYH